MFSGCTVLPDSKETELGSSDQEASPSAGKNTALSHGEKVPNLSLNQTHLSAMFVHESASLQLFPEVWIFLRSLGVICYNR